MFILDHPYLFTLIVILLLLGLLELLGNAVEAWKEVRLYGSETTINVSSGPQSHGQDPYQSPEPCD